MCFGGFENILGESKGEGYNGDIPGEGPRENHRYLSSLNAEIQLFSHFQVSIKIKGGISEG